MILQQTDITLLAVMSLFDKWYASRDQTDGTSCRLPKSDLEGQDAIFDNMPLFSSALLPPIKSSERQIRLLELLPGKFLEPVRMRVKTACLDDKPKYEALSYVWGNPLHIKYSIVDGTLYQTSEHLESGLRHIRQEYSSRMLWIDGICIDQTDEYEQALQVGLMRDIYASCEQVLVWLGDPTLDDSKCSHDEIVATFEFFNVLATTFQDTPMSPLGSNSDIELKAFPALLELPWWKRMWTVQEIILSPSATMMWGNASVPWQIIEKGVQAYLHQKASLGYSRFNKTTGKLLRALAVAVMAITEIRQGRHKSSLEVMRKFCHRKAIDPRDKVFGLLGINPYMEYTFKVDYGIDVSELYQNVAVDLINTSGSLQCLTGRRGIPALIEDLPTWAVDWSTCTETEGESLCNYWAHHYRYDEYNCSKGQKVAMSWTKAESSIAFQAVKIDNIVTTGSSCAKNCSWKALVATVSHWQDFILQSCLSECMYTERKDKHETAKRVLLGDLIVDSLEYTHPKRRPTKDDLEKLQKFVERLTDAETKKTDELKCIKHSVRTNLAGHAIFATEGGFVGFGPSTCKVGDEVWILLGGNVPFILRPASHGFSHFTLVGDGYVQGLMDGELMAGVGGKITDIVLH